MSSGAYGKGFCLECGGSLFPTEDQLCDGCKNPNFTKAKDRVATARQILEFRTMKNKSPVKLKF